MGTFNEIALIGNELVPVIRISVQSKALAVLATVIRIKHAVPPNTKQIPSLGLVMMVLTVTLKD